MNYGYDVLTNRLLSISSSLGNVGYTYNSKGQIATATSPDNVTQNFSYLGSLVTSIADSGPISDTASFTYNNDLNPASSTMAGITLSYSYDQDRLLTGEGPLALARDPSNGLVTGTTLGGLQDQFHIQFVRRGHELPGRPFLPL